MSPEHYLALLASGKVVLRRDRDGNYIFDAIEFSTSVLPRDIIEQLEEQKKVATAQHETRIKAFDRFIQDLKNAS